MVGKKTLHIFSMCSLCQFGASKQACQQWILLLQVLASDPETLHDIPLMLGRTPHELLSVDSHEGEYAFLIEVKANE